MRISSIGKLAGLFSALLLGGMVMAQDIKLPAPSVTGGKPLMEVLNQRRSTRSFNTRALPPQTLSDLLWAAWGVNRADGKRTAPSACNNQEVDLYACLPSGVYLYDAKANVLKQTLKKDLRPFCGIQPFVKTAPLCLVIVCDYSRMNRMDAAGKDFYAGIDAGYVSQNIYLFCASAGLNTVALGWVDRKVLGKEMGLKSDRKIIVTHPVGFPK